MPVKKIYSGHFLSFLAVMTFSFGGTQELLDPAYDFYLVTNTTRGTSRLSGGWFETSHISCAVSCLKYFTTNCRSFMYNPETGLCTPGSSVNKNEPPPSETEGFLYSAVNCNSSLGFTVVSAGSTVACVGVFGPRLNYTNADAACRSKGAFLMSVKTMEKLMILKHIWDSSNTWVGCDDLEENTVYRWREDGQILTNATIEVFSAGEPNTRIRGQDCVDIASKSGKLADTYCFVAYRYACEVSIQ